MADVLFEQATRIYSGTNVPAVDALDLHIEDGEFMVLVGPSGSGKTTALRMLAGLEEVDAGGIWIGGRDVTYVPPKDRDVAMVFQNYALYPYLTVAQNIGFPLKLARVPRKLRDARVKEVARRLGLADYLDRKPSQLSGGQRQRVAMGRAIVRKPSVFLMDEPLSNLDAKLRVQMRADIAALQSDFGITTVYVTHDQAEATTLGHRIAVLKDGRIQQCAAPRTLYERPANTFVAGFIGSPAMNLCTVPLATNGTVSLGGAAVRLPAALAPNAASAPASVIVGLRPESLELAEDGLPARVEMVEEFGADSFVFCAASVAGQQTKLVARVETRRAPARGDRVALRPQADEAHLFDSETGERLVSVERRNEATPAAVRRANSPGSSPGR
jgi:multiple sugar transport system ATP-binding protein